MSPTPSITIPQARWQEMISEMEGLMKLNEMLSENLAQKKSDVDYLQKNVSKLEESNSKLQQLIEVIENNHKIEIQNIQKECVSHMAHARAAAIELERERRSNQILLKNQSDTSGNLNKVIIPLDYGCKDNPQQQGIVSHPSQEINELKQLLDHTQNALAVLQELHSHCKELTYSIPNNHVDLQTESQIYNDSSAVMILNTPQRNNHQIDRNTIGLLDQTTIKAINDQYYLNPVNTTATNGESQYPRNNPSNGSQNFQSFQDLISQSSTSSLSQSPPPLPIMKEENILLSPAAANTMGIHSNNDKNNDIYDQLLNTPQIDRYNYHNSDINHYDLMASSSNSNQVIVNEDIRLRQHCRAATETKINPRRREVEILPRQQAERISIQVNEVSSSGHKISYQQPQQVYMIKSSLQNEISSKQLELQKIQNMNQLLSSQSSVSPSGCSSSSKSSNLQFRVERPEFRMSESHIISETQHSQKQQQCAVVAMPMQIQRNNNNKYRTSIEEENSQMMQERSSRNQILQQQQQPLPQQLSNEYIYLHSSSSQQPRLKQGNNQNNNNNNLRVNRNSNTPQPASNYLISSTSSPRPPLNKTAATSTNNTNTQQVSAFMVPPPMQVTPMHRALSNKLVESQIVPTETLMYSEINKLDNHRKTVNKVVDTLQQQQSDKQISIRPHREAAVSQKEEQQCLRQQQDNCQEINDANVKNRDRDNQSAPDIVGGIDKEKQTNGNNYDNFITNSMPQQHSPKRFSFQVDVNPMLSSNEEEHSKEIINQVKQQQQQQQLQRNIAQQEQTVENQQKLEGEIGNVIVIVKQGVQNMNLKMTSSLYEQQHHEQHCEQQQQQQQQEQQQQQQQPIEKQQQIFQLQPQYEEILNNNKQSNEDTHHEQPIDQPQQSGEQLERHVESLENECNGMQNIILKLRMELEQSNANEAEFIKTQASMKQIIQGLETKLQRMTESADKSKAAVKRIEQDKQLQFDRCQAEIEALRQSLKKAQEEQQKLTQLKATLASVPQEYAQLVNDMQQTVQQMEVKHNEEKIKITDNLRRSQEDLLEKQQEIEELNDDKIKMAKEMEDHLRQLDEANKEILQMRQVLLEKEQELEDVKMRLSELTQDMNRYQEGNSQEVLKYQKEIIDKQNNCVKEIEQIKQDQEQEILRIQEQHRQEKDMLIEEHNQQLEQLNNMMQEKEDKLLENTRKYINIEAELRAYEEQISQQGQLNEQRDGELQLKNEGILRKLQDAERQVVILQRELEESQAKVEEEVEFAQGLETHVQQLEEIIRRFGDDKQSYEEKIMDLVSQLVELEQGYAICKKEKKEWQRLNEVKAGQIEEYQKRLAHMNIDLAQSQLELRSSPGKSNSFVDANIIHESLQKQNINSNNSQFKPTKENNQYNNKSNTGLQYITPYKMH